MYELFCIWNIVNIIFYLCLQTFHHVQREIDEEGSCGNRRNCGKSNEEAEFWYEEEHCCYQKIRLLQPEEEEEEEDWGAIDSSGVDVVKFSPIFNVNFNYDFNVREYFGNYTDLVFAVVHNSRHYLNEHMFKPREILEEEAMMECRPVKSFFLETLGEDDIIEYVKEALLYTNLCVETERSFVINIRTE